MSSFLTNKNIFMKCFLLPAGLLFTTQVFSLEVKVGSVLSLTGTLGSYGQDAKKGMELALSEMGNSEPKIKMYTEDTLSTPAEAAKAINKLISSDKVSVVIGDMTSSNTIAAASIAEKSKIPIVSPSATNDSITQGKKYIFRACFIDSFQGTVMATFASQNLKAKTAIILEDSDSDYSKGLSKSFVEHFTKNGGLVTKVLRYSQKDTSYTSQLSEVRKSKPDIIFIPGFHQQVGVILRESKDLQIKSKVLGGDGWDTPELKQIAKGAENGSYISNHYIASGENKKLQSFVKAYKEKFKEEPSAFAALAYDSLYMVRKAIVDSKSNDPEKITAGLAAIKNFEGVTGVISMDKNHNPLKPAVVLEFTPNGYKYVTSVNP
ncbi:ABC transporter substrate-binding protein [Silvanigrella paludirubra]|uniref:ABC transporter substrate-binding protein n=1 Tax=Silvanigrella paludirubra TaxID=2499159 RepID=A0A6N6VTK5_9BACT|nr:ABC transporter substrate-binding protein [Silvanigrella paludirubra]KAB8039660.1 ABC transporter substrate-binding protein [Silvanigrella paludirubra]